MAPKLMVQGAPPPPLRIVNAPGIYVRINEGDRVCCPRSADRRAQLATAGAHLVCRAPARSWCSCHAAGYLAQYGSAGRLIT
jgi:hypothetical protein